MSVLGQRPVRGVALPCFRYLLKLYILPPKIKDLFGVLLRVESKSKQKSRVHFLKASILTSILAYILVKDKGGWYASTFVIS